MKSTNRFTPKPKTFSWSYSKLKNFESCAHRHYKVDIAKEFADEIGDSLVLGNQAHEALALAISKGKELPGKFEHLQKYVDDVTRVGNVDGTETLVEQKLAFREDFSPCEFFDNKAWFRGVIDVAQVRGPVAVIRDWKYGKVLEDSVQLALFAQLVFSHHPKVQKIRTSFEWLVHDCNTREDFSRADMADLWTTLEPRIEAMRQAYVTGEYPARKNGLCRKFCPVRSCIHYGG